jgi:hypothetical protein
MNYDPDVMEERRQEHIQDAYYERLTRRASIPDHCQKCDDMTIEFEGRGKHREAFAFCEITNGPCPDRWNCPKNIGSRKQEGEENEATDASKT